MTMHSPLHPGLIVKDLLIDSGELNITEAAKKLGISRTALSRFLNGHSNLSPEMALRLSKALDTSIEMWINLQAQYDIWMLNQRLDNEKKIAGKNKKLPKYKNKSTTAKIKRVA